MSKRIMLIDGNNIGHQANNMPKLAVGNQETQAIYGYLKILRSLVQKFPNTSMVVLWDGIGWRKSIFNEYKENRKRAETKNDLKIQERKRAYATQRPFIQQATKHLGITQMVATNMEADDLAAILTNRYKAQDTSILLVTGDQDWLQLVDRNVMWRDQINNQSVTPSNFEEKTGVKTVRQFVEKKALTGDTGDNVPPTGGIGEKYANEFFASYGSFREFAQMVTLEKSIDPASLPKRYRDLIDNEDKIFKFMRNLKLVDLNTSARPKPEGLLNIAAPISIEGFQAFCEEFLFNTILKDIHAWLAPFPTYQRSLMSAAA
ncbi:5'-3' exonuclease [Ochrobactrum sp. P20RRXII]|nr:hypothetical protein [Ochrobactrum sp. P20RRXII]NIH77466.1 5'-3' exonuclease [Ochrobactrum sp. P20RRXII]